MNSFDSGVRLEAKYLLIRVVKGRLILGSGKVSGCSLVGKYPAEELEEVSGGGVYLCGLAGIAFLLTT
jgi:hypothetical protein